MHRDAPRKTCGWNNSVFLNTNNHYSVCGIYIRILCT
ncbi:hypothetical protein GBAR_LOCUS1291 [Geodia barretti]|uniref:Uncharacterized protein n=1 Tax=Geodia barretti TaxID=519541 RepID=A0AA35QWA5_GEOBA|nr:hypothetical protein GBAR_LOCUS1291 [Geodia barretti]